MSEPDSLGSIVQEFFPEDDCAFVLELLDLYGTEPYEKERRRVQLAILRLSKGDLNKLLQLIDYAKRDYRDILCWADCPPVGAQDAATVIDGIAEMFEKSGSTSKANELRQIAKKILENSSES